MPDVTGKKIRELQEATSLNGTDTLIIEDDVPKTKRTTLAKLREWMQTNINISGKTVTFTAPNERSNVVSNDTLAAFAGKFSKLFSDLKGHAFSETVKNLTATEAGSALDATMGKQLNDSISPIGAIYNASSTKLSTTANIDTLINGKGITLPAGTYVVLARASFNGGNSGTAGPRQVSIKNASGETYCTTRVSSQWYTSLCTLCVINLQSGGTLTPNVSASVVLNDCTTIISAVRIK